MPESKWLLAELGLLTFSMGHLSEPMCGVKGITPRRMKKENGDGRESKIVVRSSDQNSDEWLLIAHGGVNERQGVFYAMIIFCLVKWVIKAHPLRLRGPQRLWSLENAWRRFKKIEMDEYEIAVF